MYFVTEIDLKENTSIHELQELIEPIFHQKNEIDKVLNGMKSITHDIEVNVKLDTIYAFQTTKFFYLF